MMVNSSVSGGQLWPDSRNNANRTTRGGNV